MHAAAARNQKAGSAALPGQQSQAEQTAEPGVRDGDLEAQDVGPLEGLESKRWLHTQCSAPAGILAPIRGACSRPGRIDSFTGHVEWGTRLAMQNSSLERTSQRRRRCRTGAGARRRPTSHDDERPMSVSTGVEQGPDSKPRCGWAVGTADYLDYHDNEWGRPLHGEAELFERITLEAFQSGLSWLTILRKRENFRRAFDGFDIERVAAYGEAEIERLLGDAGIVRNRRKIEAAITNANAAREMHADGQTLDELVWSFAPDEQPPAPKALGDLEA